MPERCLLYYITDRSQFPGDEWARRKALLAKIIEAAGAGVNYIQLREKDLTVHELEALAIAALSAIREGTAQRTENRKPETRLLINSRTDIALAVGAAGVHLRSDDVAPSEVRRIWSLCGVDALARERPMIAISCHSKVEVLGAESDGADFAVLAPIFGKKGSTALGLEVLRECCQPGIPVLALGGVTLQNAAACLEGGAAGIAGIRLFQENPMAEVVRTLRSGNAWKDDEHQQS